MWKLRAMKSMSFTVFSCNATALLIQPNPTQPMDGPNPCPSLIDTERNYVTVTPCITQTLNSTLSLPWTFSVAVPRAWNTLPTQLKLLRSTTTFRRQLKTFLFQSAYGHRDTDWRLFCDAFGMIIYCIDCMPTKLFRTEKVVCCRI